MNYFAGAVLIATFSALLYATEDVWPVVDFKRWVGSTAMDTT